MAEATIRCRRGDARESGEVLALSALARKLLGDVEHSENVDASGMLATRRPKHYAPCSFMAGAVVK